MKLSIIEKKNLFKNKISTGLTFSSVALVVCCLILLFAINEAGKREIAKSIKEGGNADRVLLHPYLFTEKGFEGKAKAILSPIDLRLIKNGCPQVKEISFYTVTDIDEMRIGNKQYFGISSFMPCIYGVPPECIKVLDIRLKEGRFINNIDMLYKRRVCVLGGEADRVIGQEKVIGKKLITKNPDGKFTIIGILHKKMPLFTALPEKMAWELLDNSEPNIKTGRKMHALEVNNVIYIPFTTWQDLVKGRDPSVISRGGFSLKSKTFNKSFFSSSSFPARTFIWIKIDISFEGEGGGKLIKDKEDLRVFGAFYYPIPQRLKEPLDSIRKILRKKYGDDKFFLFTNYGSLKEELEDQIEDSEKLLGITGIVTLLLSSVILTSMMLMSVHNRVSEIGIRRAFGARKKDIFYQFLTEGMVIYSIGIVIGLVIGLVLSYLLIVKLLSWEYSIPIYSLVLSSLIPFVVGIISSLYPAMRAANVPPAVAVKYE